MGAFRSIVNFTVGINGHGDYLGANGSTESKSRQTLGTLAIGRIGIAVQDDWLTGSPNQSVSIDALFADLGDAVKGSAVGLVLGDNDHVESGLADALSHSETINACDAGPSGGVVVVADGADGQAQG